MQSITPMGLYLTQRLLANSDITANLTLHLTAEDRSRSRHYFQTAEGAGVHLQLPRGTVLQQGDLLTDDHQTAIVRVVAKPEPVMTVTAVTPLALLKAAYHLGNRHVALEVAIDYLRLSPDLVLRSMLLQMGLQVAESILPFHPEAGAYGHRHSSDHVDEQSGNHRGEHSHTHEGDHFIHHKP